jgi:predicted Zn-dependent peptidase
VNLSVESSGDAGTERESVLINGLRVITRERRETRAVAMNLAVLAGSRDEDAATAGSAHVMEHLFFQGTTSKPSSDELSRPIIARGGVFNAATEREMIGFFLEIPSSAFHIAIETLSDVIENALFEDAAFKRVQGTVIEELRRRGNDAAQHAQDLFHDLVLAGHPAAHSPGGTKENVQALDIQSVQSYRAERFRAGNMVLAVAGGVRHDDVVRAAETGLGRIASGGDARSVASLPNLNKRTASAAGGRTSAQIVVGFSTPGLVSSDRYALVVTSSILGRAGRRLSRELRERRGITYSIATRFGALSDIGVFSIVTSVDPARTDEAIGAIVQEVQRLAQDVSEDEVAMAVGFIEGRTYLGDERNLAQARRISAHNLLGVRQSVEDYLDCIRRVRKDDVARVATEFLLAERSATVVVSP